ncbi:MAG: terminase family protein, partial [Streptococcaceae bacterium]|nr:terminase family protein [Streptococcaceae bacterium]
MKFNKFSKKQRQVMKWWTKNSPFKDRDILICDGAVRSGKTLSMSMSYTFWAMEHYQDKNFIFAGVTISALKRNVTNDLVETLKGLKQFHVKEHISEAYIDVTYQQKKNRFYLFGADNVKSQNKIQGLTAAGAFLDEAALMSEDYIKQVQARLSVEGAK